MRKKLIPNIARGRIWVLYGALIMLLSILCLRLFYIYVFKSDEYLSQGDRHSIKGLVMPASKGVIVDRNGKVLTVTTVLYSLVVDLNHLRIKPQESEFQRKRAVKRIASYKANMVSLAKIINIPVSSIISKTFMQSSKKMRAYLVKNLQPIQVDKIKKLKMPALVFEYNLRRYYPFGEVVSNTLGFSDYNNRGKSGVERAYDKYLSGSDGKVLFRRDRAGNVTSFVATNKEFKKGKSLELTIDIRVQNIAFFALKRAVKKFRPRRATAVVLKAKTGEILALANLPSYNPNDNSQRVGKGLSNVAVQELFEPGSIVKPFNALAALESKVIRGNANLHIGKGPIHKIKVKDRRFKDSSRIDGTDIPVSTMLRKSSNVGAIKLGLKMEPYVMRDFYHKVGFGSPVGLRIYGGNISGVLPQPENITKVLQASMSIGYGLNASTLQIAQAYGVLANKGKFIQSHLVKNFKPRTEQVANRRNVKLVVKWLKGVVGKDGTAPKARVSGYEVAGKTGTTLLSGGRSGYRHKKYTASFVGFAPADNPELVVAVLVDNPKGKVYYGGEVAGPVFSEIMGSTLAYLGIRSRSQSSLASKIISLGRKL